MNGQTLQKAMIHLPGGGTAIYKGSALNHYRHADWLGSARLSTTPTQTLYYDVAYAPYGEIYAGLIGSGGNTSVAFAGQGKDTPTDLYPFLFRQYNSIQSRWAWPDPAGLGAVSMESPQSWNRYAYVANNPLNATDPSGLASPYPWGDVFGSAREPDGYNYSDLGVLDIYYNNLINPAPSPNLGALGTWTFPSQGPSGQSNTFVSGNYEEGTIYTQNGPIFNPADDGGTPFGGGAANNGWSLFGWDKNAWKTFFKTAVNPLPELREGGCGRAFLDAFSEGGLFPDGGPGTEPDSLIKQAGGIAAAQYAVNQGLVVPLRSSIYRGILEGTETAASGAVLADVYTREAQGFSAEYSAFKAGSCH